VLHDISPASDKCTCHDRLPQVPTSGTNTKFNEDERGGRKLPPPQGIRAFMQNVSFPLNRFAVFRGRAGVRTISRKEKTVFRIDVIPPHRRNETRICRYSPAQDGSKFDKRVDE